VTLSPALVLPAGAVAVDVSGADTGLDPLLPAEDAALGRVGPARRRDFTAGRHCARRALAALGFPPAPLLPGPDREPRWPDGVAGSIAHCPGYAVAVAGHRRSLRTVGVDAEPHAPLPTGVLAKVTSPAEREHLAALPPGRHWDRILFCAKETVYKAWYPLTRRWLGFDDATVAFDPATATFAATILVPAPVGGFAGRFAVHGGLVVTTIAESLPKGSSRA
jgi:4'-phosphopantetheinyl transferase EntD